MIMFLPNSCIEGVGQTHESMNINQSFESWDWKSGMDYRELPEFIEYLGIRGY